MCALAMILRTGMIKEGKVNCFGVTHHVERDLVDESLLKNNKSPAAKEDRKDSRHWDITNVDVNKSMTSINKFKIKKKTKDGR